MSIRILLLYPEYMGLSGDMGNLLALRHRLHSLGLRCEVTAAGIGDAMPFSEFDLIYAGNAPLSGLLPAMADIAPRADALRAAMEAGRIFLLTGSARCLLGGDLTLRNGTVAHGARLLAESHREVNRFTGEILATRPGLGRTLYLGCYDRVLETDAASERPLFQTVRGMGDKPAAIYEGVFKNNIYATYMLGPVLVRNPELLEEIVEKLAGGQYRPRGESFDAAAKAAHLAALEKKKR